MNIAKAMNAFLQDKVRMKLYGALLIGGLAMHVFGLLGTVLLVVICELLLNRGVIQKTEVACT